MKTSDNGEQLRAEILRTGGASRGRGAGYPVAVRARVLAHVQESRARGEGLKRVAARLGLCSTTLRKWSREPSPRFAPVTVVRSSAGVVLVSPTGWRAEVDVETLASLVGGR